MLTIRMYAWGKMQGIIYGILQYVSNYDDAVKLLTFVLLLLGTLR